MKYAFSLTPLFRQSCDFRRNFKIKELTTVFICPKDKHNQAILRRYVNEGWKVIEVPLLFENLSGSEIRRRIQNGDDWEAFVPKGTAETIKSLNRFVSAPHPISTSNYDELSHDLTTERDEVMIQE